MDKKTSSKFVIIFMISLLAVSAVLAWIMIGNYSKDTSKERSKLTRDHKAAMKENYSYDADRGLKVYNQFCLRCHGVDGKGGLSAPPLSGSPIVNGSYETVVKIINNGMKGKIQRAGKTYDLVMPGFPMITHEDFAHVVNYIRTSFGNSAETVTKEQVIKAKIDSVEKTGQWTEAEL